MGESLECRRDGVRDRLSDHFGRAQQGSALSSRAGGAPQRRPPARISSPIALGSVVGSRVCGWSERAVGGGVASLVSSGSSCAGCRNCLRRGSSCAGGASCGRGRAAPDAGVCTRRGGGALGMRGRSAPGSGVCTRRGGGIAPIGVQSPRPGCKPPCRVHGCGPGGAVSPRPGCKPPSRVQTPATGAQSPYRWGAPSQPPAQGADTAGSAVPPILRNGAPATARSNTP